MHIQHTKLNHLSSMFRLTQMYFVLVIPSKDQKSDLNKTFMKEWFQNQNTLINYINKGKIRPVLVSYLRSMKALCPAQDEFSSPALSF